MVSGMLIREEHLDKLDKKKSFLKKCLGLNPKDREYIIKASANSWFGNVYWPSNDFLMGYGAHDCILVDEQKPLRKGSNSTIVRVKHTQENQPETFYNVKHRRIWPRKKSDYYEDLWKGKQNTKPEWERLNWVVAEGTSLTLLGMLKYDI